jgi:hypothetical protein
MKEPFALSTNMTKVYQRDGLFNKCFLSFIGVALSDLVNKY